MAQKYQLTTSQWLALKPEVKAKLKEIFSIPKSSGSVMVQQGGFGHLQSDGHTMSDLAAITLEKMAAYLGGEPMTDFYGTFDLVLEKVETNSLRGKEFSSILISEDEKGKIEIVKAVVAPPTEISAAIAEGEKMPEKFHDDTTFDVDFDHLPKPDDGTTIVTMKFCQFCTSKGVRHLNVCTRPR